ncbi:MAG: enoyl-CoA hydratase/isomerase family protein [Mycobacterium sp.]
MTGPATGLTVGFRTEDHQGVLVVTLDRPPANALDRALIRDLAALFAELAATPAAPPVVLTGRGERFFCAGGDIKALDGADQCELDSRMREFHELLVQLDRYPRPVVAAINGHCVGGGMEIALFADTVVAVDHARFGFPEINHGLLPADKGVQRATRLLGVRATRSILLTGNLFDARHATEIGLVDRILDPDELIGAAVSAARDAGEKARVLYGALKLSINDPDDALDDTYLSRTLAAAATYFDDPQARRLRENWNGGSGAPAQAQPC